VLYNVQLAEQEGQRVRRQYALNLIAALLAAFALISVSTDIYFYLSGSDTELIPLRRDRGEVLGELLGGFLLLAVFVIFFIFLSPWGRRRR
jgi:hypothetical protein